MKVQIRHGTFETNSSSTHAISIAKRDPELKIPEKVVFMLNYYGWEENVYHDTLNKASYLFSAIMQKESWLYTPRQKEEYILSKSKRIEKLQKILLKNNIDYEFVLKHMNGEDDDIYGIDPNDLDEFIDSVLRSEKRLLSYLFSENSFVCTGNDNSDTYMHVGKTKTHYIYEKGN